MYTAGCSLAKSVGQDRCCIIVDAFSSGSMYASHFNVLGLKCIHVQSRRDIKLVASTYRSRDFIANFQYEGDIESLVHILEQLSPLFVMPGFHTGVYLAEELGTRLKIPSNNSHSSKLRMDKFFMHKKLAEDGLDFARSYLTSSVEYILSRFESDFAGQSVIVKPSNSAGTDSVFLCRNCSEVINAYGKIISEVNVMDITNEKVLIQEYLYGTEYIVNTVTYRGKHVVTDIWRSDKIKINGNIVYDKTVLLEAEGKIQEELIRYNNKVLDALEFTFGACHNELIYTDRGPVLVETNPRVSGGHLPEIALECTGMGQILWVRDIIEDLVSGKSFTNPLRYRLNKNACSVCFISRDEGTVTGYRNLEKIKSLSSYHSMDIRVNIGERLVKTVDVWTGPGMVVLIHEDPRVIEADYKRIRELEDEIFILE